MGFREPSGYQGRRRDRVLQGRGSRTQPLIVVLHASSNRDSREPSVLRAWRGRAPKTVNSSHAQTPLPATEPSQRQRRVERAYSSRDVRHFPARRILPTTALAGCNGYGYRGRGQPGSEAMHAFIVVPLGGSNHGKVIVDALNRHQKFLRGELARQGQHLKFTPALTFRARPRPSISPIVSTKSCVPAR